MTRGTLKILIIITCLSHTAGFGFASFGLDTLRLCVSAREEISAGPRLVRGGSLYIYGEGNFDLGLRWREGIWHNTGKGRIL